MAYLKNTPLTDLVMTVFNPTIGSSSGSKSYASLPFRGQLLEAGFTPNSVITSNTTLAVTIAQWLTSTASIATEVITSTLGSFNSVQLVEGTMASVNPPSPSYFNAGDTIKWVSSGGQTSLVSGTFYAILRKV